MLCSASSQTSLSLSGPVSMRRSVPGFTSVNSSEFLSFFATTTVTRPTVVRVALISLDPTLSQLLHPRMPGFEADPDFESVQPSPTLDLLQPQLQARVLVVAPIDCCSSIPVHFYLVFNKVLFYISRLLFLQRDAYQFLYFVILQSSLFIV